MDTGYHIAPAPLGLRRLLALLAVSWGLATCGDPCRDLSEKICSCLDTYEARQSCNSRINTLASQFNTDPARPSWLDAQQVAAGQHVCGQLLDTCTCEALQQGDLKACGLANEAAGP